MSTPDDLAVLSEAWALAGRGLRQPGIHNCVVGGCRSMSFVALKTSAGNKTVCFQHFSLLDRPDAPVA